MIAGLEVASEELVGGFPAAAGLEVITYILVW